MTVEGVGKRRPYVEVEGERIKVRSKRRRCRGQEGGPALREPNYAGRQIGGGARGGRPGPPSPRLRRTSWSVPTLVTGTKKARRLGRALGKIKIKIKRIDKDPLVAMAA